MLVAWLGPRRDSADGYTAVPKIQTEYVKMEG